MSQFVHVIMTRFNVPTKGWNETRSGYKPLTEEWLDDRFKLFRTYVLPSYKNQTNQNYIWLTFFDTNTSDKFRKIIKEIESIKNNTMQSSPVFGWQTLSSKAHKALRDLAQKMAASQPTAQGQPVAKAGYQSP